MLNLGTLAGYSLNVIPRTRTEVNSLTRYRSLLFLLVAAGLAVMSPRLFGKGAPCDILIQTTTDVYAELAPCG
jgi:hypothetical protein